MKLKAKSKLIHDGVNLDVGEEFIEKRNDVAQAMIKAGLAEQADVKSEGKKKGNDK